VHPETLSIKINRPDVEVHEMTDSCSLDVADSRDATLEDVGNMFSVTRERARQIEGIALEKCKSTLGDVLFWYLDEAEET
jgi:hypothetical protein